MARIFLSLAIIYITWQSAEEDRALLFLRHDAAHPIFLASSWRKEGFSVAPIF